MDKPEIVEEKHLLFLDELRKSGVTNMFGATPYIQEEFMIDRKEAKEILVYWMKSFSERHPNGR